MTESSELKPCPMCGGKAELEDHRLVWMVCCTECNAMFRGERADEPDTEEDANDIDWNYYERTAIDGWNTRHADSAEIDQLRARVAELVESLERIKAASSDEGTRAYCGKMINRTPAQSLAAVQSEVLEKLADGCWGSVNGRGSVLSYEEIKAEAARIRREAGL